MPWCVHQGLHRRSRQSKASPERPERQLRRGSDTRGRGRMSRHGMEVATIKSTPQRCHAEAKQEDRQRCTLARFKRCIQALAGKHEASRRGVLLNRQWKHDLRQESTPTLRNDCKPQRGVTGPRHHSSGESTTLAGARHRCWPGRSKERKRALRMRAYVMLFLFGEFFPLFSVALYFCLTALRPRLAYTP